MTRTPHAYRHAALCLALLLFSSIVPASANNALAAMAADDAAKAALARLDGAWKVDIEASLRLRAAQRTDAMPAYEMENLRATLAQLGLVIDAAAMRVTEQGPEGDGGSFDIDALELEENTLRISGDRRRYSLTLRDDGSILLGAGVLMRREAAAPASGESGGTGESMGEPGEPAGEPGSASGDASGDASGQVQ